ncbi:hypothetical protein DFH09DRAFT_1166747 [Mycena vulgaris]|nr:hypothetical protein DFH09DRAFT_1166747 [Mycena vulgaris]
MRHCRVLWATLLLGITTATAAADCLSKFKTLRDAGGDKEGGMDNYGHGISIANATAMSYALCVETCGFGPSFRPWSVFSQRFSTWLLPFLALVSQLPFGGNSRLENIMSMMLNVGSPTLGAYSVILTLLNGYWIARKFSHISYPNVQHAVRILTSLQQAPLRVTTEDGLLASLIILPQNNPWWSDLILWLDINYTHTWSFANVASIGWVVIAFTLTVIDTFTNITNNASPPLNSNGLAVAFAWLWLLPIVITWLQIGPRCDRLSIQRAVRHANGLAFLATHDGDPMRAELLSSQHAISVPRRHTSLSADEHRTSPIYNYARLFRWTAAVEAVHSAFDEASCRAERHMPVDPDKVWVHGPHDAELDAENRRGSMEHVASYAGVGGEHAVGRRPISTSIIFRILISSISALVLTWGTVSAAMLIKWFTPTIGLSCRSGSYLVYICLSTIVWLIVVISSLLSSIVSPRSEHAPDSLLLVRAAILLRRVGKILAALNSIWIVLICLFQFIGVYDTCWCSSSFLYLGSRAYSVWILTPMDIQALWYPTVGGTVLACGVVVGFIGFTNVLLDPQITS